MSDGIEMSRTGSAWPTPPFTARPRVSWTPSSRSAAWPARPAAAGPGDTPPVPPAPVAAPSPEAILQGAARDVAAGNLATAVSALQALEADTVPSAVRRQ